MNVYDFDGTIYDGDSTKDFYRFCLFRNPHLARYLPAIGVDGAQYVLRRMPTQTFKDRFLRRLVPYVNLDAMVNGFWHVHHRQIKDWYFAHHSPDDLVISASPEFLLRPICERLGVELIATDVDTKTGEIRGLNMRDEEKVRAFTDAYPGVVPDEFYTDSLADTPMIQFSKTAFMVRGSKITRIEKGA